MADHLKIMNNRMVLLNPKFTQKPQPPMKAIISQEDVTQPTQPARIKEESSILP
jgi:hypothetical protein